MPRIERGLSELTAPCTYQFCHMCSTPTVLPISNRAHSTALQSGHIYYHIIQYDGILLHGSLSNHIPPEYVYRLQDLNLRIPTERDLKSRGFS